MVSTVAVLPGSQRTTDFRVPAVWRTSLEGTRTSGDTWSGEPMYIGLGTLILIIILILLLT